MASSGENPGLLEHLLFVVAEGVSGQTGEAFLHSTVQRLATALEADLVFIAELHPDGKRITTLAAFGAAAADAPKEYMLAGTPCANVVKKRSCSYPSGLQQMFPDAIVLAQLGAQGYVGSSMIGSGGRCLGLLSALTRQPLRNPKQAETLLQIMATNAAAELERKNYEDAFAESEKRLLALVTHGVEAVLRIEFEQPISLDLSEGEQIERVYRDGFVADCNAQAALLFGRAGAEDLIGARMDLVSPREDPDEIERLRAWVRSQWQSSRVERTIDGRPILITHQGEIDHGNLTGVWLTARDLTGIKQVEADVLRLNSELKQDVAELIALKTQLEQDNAYLLDEIKAGHKYHQMVGNSPPFREVMDRIRTVAGTMATVLITGETGTGKELVARAIHNLSPRKDRPLVIIDCAAISADLIESELFGHIRGAFAGATERRAGRFEQANGGTLFLDEITELPLESQSKLLRVLQEHVFESLGSNRTVKVDVRILAATNRDLTEAVREGRFRKDLYDRLLVNRVDVPPLRERREDIPALAAHFVKALARQFGRPVPRISESTMARLVAYDWPGNIRELENQLARAVVLSPGEVPEAPLDPGAAHSAPEASRTQSLLDAERRHVEGILASTRWVVEGPKGAAKILEMNPSTLRSLMKRLGIRRPV